MTLPGMRCPPAWKLERAASEGMSRRLVAHVRSCASCAAELESIDRMLGLSRALPKAPLPAPARERIAAVLLDLTSASDGGRSQSRWPRLLAALGAVAITCFAALGARHVVRARARSKVAITIRSHANVRPVGAVRFARTRPPPDEVLTLDDGTIDIDVTPLSANERFRIVTGDSEVEVRGTSFRVSAQGSELTAVYVTQGRVDVARRDERPITLNPGEQWTRAPHASPVLPGDPSRAAVGLDARKLENPGRARVKVLASRQRVRDAAANPTAPSGASASMAFDEGWRLLRAGHPDEAAAKFAEIEKRPDAAQLAEDAMFWRAVALGRLGRSAETRAALDAFLTRFPASGRRGEAAVMLGWNLLEQGERGAAQRLFESAANDPVDRVRASARTGLARARAE